MFYYYKQKIYEQSAKIQAQKTPEQVLAFEVQILKDRLTRLYRHLEQRASAVNTKARDVAILATVAQDTAIKILKLESEGLKALSGKNNKITSNKVATEQQISQN
jgi:nitrogenase molybdenum-iron protein alpha/beta subunit